MDAGPKINKKETKSLYTKYKMNDDESGACFVQLANRQNKTWTVMFYIRFVRCMLCLAMGLSHLSSQLSTSLNKLILFCFCLFTSDAPKLLFLFRFYFFLHSFVRAFFAGLILISFGVWKAWKQILRVSLCIQYTSSCT